MCECECFPVISNSLSVASLTVDEHMAPCSIGWMLPFGAIEVNIASWMRIGRDELCDGIHLDRHRTQDRIDNQWNDASFELCRSQRCVEELSHDFDSRTLR